MSVDVPEVVAGHPAKSVRRCKVCFWVLTILLLLSVLTILWLVLRFTIDEPVVYEDPVEHFKYGSTGGERESGFPYWIWKALPKVCADYLPGEGYASLGMLYEEDKDLPIGVSKRRVTGLDRVFLNCAVCHTNTLRDTPDSVPQIITGMPANTLDLFSFEQFFFNCAADARFSPDFIMPVIESMDADLDLIDRYLVYPLAVYLMRDQVLMLKERFKFVEHQPVWGPGRVDTFNSAKVIFNFPLDKARPEELVGTTDFPSIWNQRQKEGMHLHWDGNNTRLQERNRSAAFGAGATPPTLDRESVKRMEEWLMDSKPPPWAWSVDKALSSKGAEIYAHYCAECHGASGTDFTGAQVGKVLTIDEIGTDRYRLDSYTRTLAVNQNLLYTGYGDERFSNFRKTNGYANMPLDGLWLRAPYLHNGSVPTLQDLLSPAADRPQQFYRGYDVYDPVNVGFVTTVAAEGDKSFFLFDTNVAGNSNRGHEGAAYGTQLSISDKQALLEFLKTF
ncbi:MAG: cytochrome c [Pseudomonadota bacterium]